MAKKNLKSGLENLFAEDELHSEKSKDLVVLGNKKEVERTTARKVNGGKKKKARSSSKNFMSDLDSLFEDATATAIEELESKSGAAKHSGQIASKLRRRRPVSGLDSLIRQTIEVREVRSNDKGKTKRITVAVERKNVDKLKEIARKEKIYLKDIVSEIVKEYIQSYGKD